MTVHHNSLACYDTLDLSEREAVVLRCYVESIAPLSDREAKERLKFEDMNQVRPRVTAMVQRGWMEECGDTIDHVSGKTVRICRPTALALVGVRK